MKRTGFNRCLSERPQRNDAWKAHEHCVDSVSWRGQVAAGVYHAARTYGCCGKSDEYGMAVSPAYSRGQPAPGHPHWSGLPPPRPARPPSSMSKNRPAVSDWHGRRRRTDLEGGRFLFRCKESKRFWLFVFKDYDDWWEMKQSSDWEWDTVESHRDARRWRWLMSCSLHLRVWCFFRPSPTLWRNVRMCTWLLPTCCSSKRS